MTDHFSVDSNTQENLNVLEQSIIKKANLVSNGSWTMIDDICKDQQKLDQQPQSSSPYSEEATQIQINPNDQKVEKSPKINEFSDELAILADQGNESEPEDQNDTTVLVSLKNENFNVVESSDFTQSTVDQPSKANALNLIEMQQQLIRFNEEQQWEINALKSRLDLQKLEFEQDQERQTKDFQSEKAKLNEELKKANDQLSKANDELNKAKEELQESNDTRISFEIESKSKIWKLNAEISNLEDKVFAMKKEQAKTESEQNSMIKSLKDQLSNDGQKESEEISTMKVKIGQLNQQLDKWRQVEQSLKSENKNLGKANDFQQTKILDQQVQLKASKEKQNKLEKEMIDNENYMWQIASVLFVVGILLARMLN